MGFPFAVSFFLFLKSLYLFVVQIDMVFKLFAILQKYDFSSKSQLKTLIDFEVLGWIIVHEMEWGECMVNSISESPAIQKHTKKE